MKLNGKNKLLIITMMLFFVLTSINAQKINIKVGSVAPENSPWSIEQKKIMSEWAQITDGNVRLTFMPATALGGEKGMIQKMRVSRPGQKAPLSGAVFTNIGVYELAPKSNVMTLCVPFVFQSQEELTAVLEQTNDQINKAIEEQGFVLLGWFNVGWAHFFTKTEVRTPDQLKNISLSVGGLTSPELGRAFQLAGYKTSDVPNEKILSSLKSSTGCGGLYTIPMYAYAAQYSKYAKYVLGMPICPVMAAFVINKDVWASIPEKYKPELLASIKRAENAFIDVQQQNDKTYLDKIASEGGVIVELTDAEKEVFAKELYNDALKMATSGESSIVNYEFFKQIDSIVKEVRGK